MKNIIFAIVIILSISSCETIVNNDALNSLAKGTPQVVVHGYISPQDTNIVIRVGYSKPVVGEKVYYSQSQTNSQNTDLGFKVELSDGVKTTIIPYVSITNTPVIYNFGLESNHVLLASKFPIAAGKTYFLKITDKEGKIYESSCTIPQKVDFGVSKVANPKQPNNSNYQLTWQDPKGVANYYTLGGKIFELYKIKNPNDGQEYTYSNSIEIYFDEYNGGNLLDDINKDGQSMSLTSKEYYYGFNTTQTNTTFYSYRLELNLISCDKNYYDYHKAISTFDGGNPFAEPTLIPSNIKGGLGCFAGYNKTTYVEKK